MKEPLLAFDIGGANIKSVTNSGETRSVCFPMWKRFEQLSDTLEQMLSDVAEDAAVVATMTGELADCFATKEQGVGHIVSALEQAVGNRTLHIYLTNGQFASANTAREEYRLAAASNWHALAAYVGSQKEWQNSLLIDIGSTTCDVIPIVAGQVRAVGKTDIQRLLAGELVYMGVERTPITCLTAELPYRGKRCPIAREFFATTLDVQLILRRVTEQIDNFETADGKAATRAHAVTRLGRCLCADRDEWSPNDADTAARYLGDRMAALLFRSISQVYQSHPTLREAPIVISGHGESLLEPLFDSELPRSSVSLLRDHIGAEASRSAPAYALVYLAEQLL